MASKKKSSKSAKTAAAKKAEAIKPDTEPGLEQWLKLNADLAPNWPNITVKRDPPADAKAFDGKPDKFKDYFSDKPGEGD